MQHLHLDALGGAAGDMFVAALLDAFPEHREATVRAAGALAGVRCSVLAHDDGTLTGTRFVVDAAGEGHDGPAHRHGGHHGHAHWRGIRGRIEGSELPEAVRRHAVGIFGCLAEAEARVHGVAADDVVFHEVGAVDSVADIVAAAWLIEAVGPASWSCGPLPLGSGRVHTAHGLMPVPAPATAILLQGFAVHDDGVPGERVTPTGAAILRYLGCAVGGAGEGGGSGAAGETGAADWGSGSVGGLGGEGGSGGAEGGVGGAGRASGLAGDERAGAGGVDRVDRRPGRAGALAGVMRRSGHGFGSRRLPGMSNCLRLLVLETGAAPDEAAALEGAGSPEHRSLAVVSFEVDDQSGEELSSGLERVRATGGVHDVVQMAACGKKGRMAVHVQVLARPERLDAVVEACFRETTTIGLRTHLVQGRALPRCFADVTVGGMDVTVKLVGRPGGVSGKAEAESVRPVAGHAARARLRREAEQAAEGSPAAGEMMRRLPGEEPG